MKAGFYPRLAWDGIRKNRRMYLPYILASAGMVMMTYIVTHLRYSDTLSVLRGWDTIESLLNIGVFILAFFAAIFLFYTNSFLIRRRMKEFGLYNILGMRKSNIAAILVWETLFVALISIGLGLFLGVALSKLAEVGFVNLLKGTVTYDVSVSPVGIILTTLMFGAIFFLLLLNSLRRIWFSSSISLLRSENSGEKPPKANWLLGTLGVVILAGAYYIAVTIKDPIQALSMFFVAVIMVIVATYLIMIAGSVMFCRILQKKKNYYYKANHFVSVSSMVYRMKRNGAGLASICILATMVLVMISATSAMFIGSEDVIGNNFPREIVASFSFDGVEDPSDSQYTDIRSEIDSALKKRGVTADNLIDCRMISVAGLLNDGNVVWDSDEIYDYSIGSSPDTHMIYLIPLADYNSYTGRDTVLADDEALVYANRTEFTGDVFGFSHARHYRVREHLTEGLPVTEMSTDVLPSLMVVVPDISEAVRGLTDGGGNDLGYCRWHLMFDTALDDEGDADLTAELKFTIRKLLRLKAQSYSISVQNREEQRTEYYGMYGGIFYLAIILSIVFIFAAVLIIYYKQLSEGYEDQSRFGIMKKVGMTGHDIRRSINSQLLTVFFLPLLGAGLHMIFAFPIIEKLLMLFNLHNRMLFICTTAGSFLVFGVFYAIVYRITSNVYYQIVSGIKERE